MANVIRRFLSKNPFNGQILKEFNFLTNQEVLEKLKLSVEGFKKYSKTTTFERSQKLSKLGAFLEKNPEKVAKLITQEMGKPITQSIAEVKKSATVCNYYAENLEKLLKNEIVQTEARKCYVRFEPMGTIFMITPFNFPFYLTFKGAIANLALGNVLMVRPADSTPQVGLIIEELMKEAGFINNEFMNMFTTIEQTDLLLSNIAIKGVSFTGSSFAGGKIGQIAGKYVKKSVMELGGSDPFIVLKDADPEFAANLAVKSRSANCGQVCLSAKRFLIDEALYDEFVKRLVDKLSKLVLGDPMNEQTQMGPLAREDLREAIDKQVKQSLQEGGNLLYGGKKVETPELKNGYFYEPTVIACENENNIICREETFGPVFAILKTKSVEEQIRIANNSDFGLGAVVVSNDLEKAEKIAEQLECGMTFVNEIVKSDARYPSGGVKYSGFGRECGEYGIKEFANIKSVWIN